MDLDPGLPLEKDQDLVEMTGVLLKCTELFVITVGKSVKFPLDPQAVNQYIAATVLKIKEEAQNQGDLKEETMIDLLVLKTSQYLTPEVEMNLKNLMQNWIKS